MERGYAFSPGPIAENIITGLRSGLLGAERTRDADQAYQDRQEDRGYLRTDRAYQDKQRANAEKKLQYEKDLDFATANFVRSDGTNLGPIMDVYKKYSGDTAGDASVVPNQDGTFTFTESGGSAQKMTKEQLRSVGMNMIESMRDPKALIKSWNEKPQIHSTAEGAVSDAWNPRTRQWERVTTNPKDPKKDAAGKYNPLSNAKEIARLIGERLGGRYDDITGKMIKPPDDPELATALIAAAHEYERQNPGKLLPGEVVKNVFDQVVEAPREEDVRKKVRKEISDKTGYFSTDEADLGMPRKEYEKMRVKELAGSGFGIGKPAAPAAKPGQRTADDVKAEYKAGRLTREQAKKELKSMGFQ